jgi:hypothetical protein
VLGTGSSLEFVLNSDEQHAEVKIFIS